MIPFKKLDKRATIPTRANPWDAGLDIRIIEDVNITSLTVIPAKTGLAVAIPEGHVGFLTIRSSLGKQGVQLANAPGVIDAGYRGEIVLMLTINHGEFKNRWLAAGDRVAQLVVCPFAALYPELVEELPESDGRETGGFGSSGK